MNKGDYYEPQSLHALEIGDEPFSGLNAKLDHSFGIVTVKFCRKIQI